MSILCREFEFNEEFLIFIADAVYSCQYGTFLCDSECERLEIKSVIIDYFYYCSYSLFFINDTSL